MIKFLSLAMITGVSAVGQSAYVMRTIRLEPDSRVCVAAVYKPIVTGTNPNGREWNASFEFAGRLDQLYAQNDADYRKLKKSAFHASKDPDSDCAGSGDIRIWVEYLPLANGHPYEVRYRISQRDIVLTGSRARDLALDPGTSVSTIRSPYVDPTSNVLNLDMINHAREVVRLIS